MKKMVENFIGKVKGIANADFLDSQEKGVVKVHLFDLALVPLGVLFYYFKNFLKIASVYAVLISVLAFATDFSYVCTITGFTSNGIFSCSMSPALYFTFFILRMVLVMMFFRMWYKSIVLGDVLKFKDMLTIEMTDLKMMFVFLLIMLVNIAPFIAFVILYNRVPNPDWRIESVVFAIVSIGFVMPFLAMRFYSLPVFVLAKEKMPSLLKMWRRGKGNSLKIIFSVAIIIILCAVVMSNYNVLAVYLLNKNMLPTYIILEFVYNLLYLMFFCFFINHCLLQKGILFSEIGKDK